MPWEIRVGRESAGEGLRITATRRYWARDDDFGVVVRGEVVADRHHSERRRHEHADWGLEYLPGAPKKSRESEPGCGKGDQNRQLDRLKVQS